MTLPTTVRRDSAAKKQTEAKKSRILSTSILLLLHVILWLSIGALVMACIILVKADSDLIPSAALLIAASAGSLGYLVSHTLFYRHVNSAKSKAGNFDSDDDSIDYEYDDRMKKIIARGAPAYIGVRLAGISALLWVCAAGWGLVVAVRRPICLQSHAATENVSIVRSSWQAGLPCYLQRAGTGVGITLLIVTLALFVCMSKADKPFQSHLFGKAKSLVSEKGSESIDIYFQENSTTRQNSLAKAIRTKPLPPIPKESDTNSTNEDAKSQKSFERTHYAARSSIDRKMSMDMETQSMLSRVASRASLMHKKSMSSLKQSKPAVTLNHSRSMPAMRQAQEDGKASSTTRSATPSRYHRPNHQRSASTPFVYPARAPVYRQIDYSQMQKQPYKHTVASMGVMNAPSTWKAIHPPTTTFKYASGYPRAPARTGQTIGFSQIRAMPTSQNPYFASTVGRPRTSASSSSHSSQDSGQYPASWSHYPVVPSGYFLSGQPIPAAIPHRQTSSRSSNSSRYGVGSRSARLSSHAESDEDAITSITTPPSEGVPHLSSIKESRVQNPVFPVRAGHLRSNSTVNSQYPSRDSSR